MTQALLVAFFLAIVGACSRQLPQMQQAPALSTPYIPDVRWRPAPRPTAPRRPVQSDDRSVLESIDSRLMQLEESIAKTRRDLAKPPVE